ncbi:MAG: hypothetical protein IBX67_01110 [Dehalococcoidia bacterium]|nr:hypothetical protein [Dehalococcoidia bacterium]
MAGTMYEERIYSRWNITIMSIVVFALLAVLIRQLVAGPLGTNPAPNSFLMGMIVLFLAIGVNFAALRVSVDMRGILVGYGIIRHQIPWGEVVGCRLDEASAIRYGGWGIRTGWVGGKRRLVYNIIGAPRVVVEKRLGNYQEFIFSTGNPEAVMKAINEGLGRRS